MPTEHTPDIIYLEADSEITEAIDKFKAAKAREVRVAVPARSTLLQSAVNIKLLKKAATSHHKNLVLVSNDKATISLAAGLGVLVAKNVKAEAMVPEMAAGALAAANSHEPVVIEEEVEQATAKGKKAKESAKESESFQKQHIPLSEEAEAEAEQPTHHHTPAVGELPKDKRVPNFKGLNKKIFAIVTVIAVLVILVLGYIFLPTAKVTLLARAQKTPVSVKFSLDAGTKKSNFSTGDIAADQVSTTKQVNAQFSATGQKDVGQKATGNVKLSNATSSNQVNVPAGTVLSSGGKTFTLTQAAVVPGATVNGGIVPGTVNATISATQNGDSYNLSNATFSVASAGPQITATGSTTGGVSHVATVVSQGDIDKAKQALIESSTATAKSELQNKAGDNQRVFEQTLAVEATAVTSSVPVDGEASTATLNAQIKFSELAARNSDLDELFKTQIQNQVPQGSEIYQSGASDATYKLIKSFGADKADMQGDGNAYYGQIIDKDQVAHDVAGKNKKDAGDAVTPKYPQVTQVLVETNPSLVPNITFFANRITVEIKVRTD